MKRLNEVERDALAETFNIALGDAVAALADIVHEEVQMAVPEVEFLDTAQLVRRLSGAGEPGTGGAATLAAEGHSPMLCSIGQRFSGSGLEFRADAMLLFPALGCVGIVRRMLGHDAAADDQASELEQDALAEVGNIVINSCMTKLACIFEAELVGTLPRVRMGRADELLPRALAGSVALVMQIGMTLYGQRLEGAVLLLMDSPSLELTIRRTQIYFRLDAQSVPA